MDGVIDASWDAAPWTDEFIDISGPDFPKPRHVTRAKMLWDDEFLYIAAWLDEPRVWATYTERDSIIFHENDFEVFLDPKGTGEDYLELEINALGTVWDLRLPWPYRAGGDPDNGFCYHGLLSGVHVDGPINEPIPSCTGWSVTLGLPFADIQNQNGTPAPEEGDVWRINFSRVQWLLDDKLKKVPDRPEDNWVWTPQWAIDMHRPELWGYLHFCGSEAPEALPLDPFWPEREQLSRAWYATPKGKMTTEHLQMDERSVILPRKI